MLCVYTRNNFPEEYTVFDNYDVNMTVQNSVIHFSLWDTEGTNEEDEYKQLRCLAYPKTSVLLLCFSVVNKSSLVSASSRWKMELDELCSGIPVILVGTKADLREDQSISADDIVIKESAERIAEQIGAAAYMETSARLNTGVKEVFDKCLEIRFGRLRPSKQSCVIV